MKEENKLAFDKLEKAYLKLGEGAKSAKDELGEDGVIQRFEFTFELLWKALKIFMQKKGVEARTPKDVLKEAFRLEWLGKEKVFLNMLDDRNKTSHIYDQKTSREIFERITRDYVPAIEIVLKNLRKLL